MDLLVDGHEHTVGHDDEHDEQAEERNKKQRQGQHTLDSAYYRIRVVSFMFKLQKPSS